MEKIQYPDNSFIILPYLETLLNRFEEGYDIDSCSLIDDKGRSIVREINSIGCSAIPCAECALNYGNMRAAYNTVLLNMARGKTDELHKME